MTDKTLVERLKEVSGWIERLSFTPDVGELTERKVKLYCEQALSLLPPLIAEVAALDQMLESSLQTNQAMGKKLKEMEAENEKLQTDAALFYERMCDADKSAEQRYASYITQLKAERDGWKARYEAIVNPIVQMKMMQSPPPMFLVTSEEEKQRIESQLKEGAANV